MIINTGFPLSMGLVSTSVGPRIRPQVQRHIDEMDKPKEKEVIYQDLPVTIFYPSSWGKARVLQDIDQKRYHLVNRQTFQDESRQWRLEAKMPFRRPLSKKAHRSALNMMAAGALMSSISR
jgi:hypothetical protein